MMVLLIIVQRRRFRTLPLEETLTCCRADPELGPSVLPSVFPSLVIRGAVVQRSEKMSRRSLVQRPGPGVSAAPQS